MIFRNSILSILRSKRKSALFLLLIFALTLALALSVSVWAAIAQFLDDCDDYYTTIGIVEYMGTSYPDDNIFDPSMAEALENFNAAEIKADDSVIRWEIPSRSFGYIEGFWRSDAFMPDKMLSVFVVGNVNYSTENAFYTAVVYKTLYSTTIEDNKLIYIDENFGQFEPGHYYLVFGEVYRGYSPILHLRSAAFDNALAAADGIQVPAMLDITAEPSESEFYNIPEDTVLLEIANTLSVTNNSVLVVGTDNLLALLPFHQEELFIVDGRAFSEEEYTSGERVAVISEVMAARLGIGIGDPIELSVAISDQPGFYNSYWVGQGFNYHETFKVVGITNTVMDKSWHVYVPREAGVPSSPFPIGYTVGHAILKNHQAADFFTRMEPTLENRFQLRMYDQGYSIVAVPYQTILSTAKIVTFVCALVELAVLVFFGFLFVYRQREASETMLMLGTGKMRVVLYFLLSAGLISLIASASGAAAGYWLHEGIIRWVGSAAQNYTEINSRFSNGNLSVARTLEFAPKLNWQLFLIIGVIVFLFALIACFVFILGSFKNNKPSQKQAQGPKGSHKTSPLRGGGLKYTILSILRGGERSYIVPVLSLVVVIFFGQLTTTSTRYQRQLEAIYEDTTIEGYFTDIKGKQIGNLVLNAYDMTNLFHSGHLNSLNISKSEPYYFLGVSKKADGTPVEISPLYVPRNSFRRESLETVVLSGPDLTATNNIQTSPEFYYADTIQATYLDGYDESFITLPATHSQALACIIPTSFMKGNHITLGDTIRLAINKTMTNPDDNQRIFVHYDLHVIGSYEKQGTEDTIYTPLSLFFDTNLIWGAGRPATGEPSVNLIQHREFTEEEIEALQSTVFHSTNFTLKDSKELSTFKDYLDEYGYSQVNQVSQIREFIIIKDASFNNTVASVRQQNRYINLLHPFLYFLVGIIALTASYLLVISRKNEFAIMRGLGANQIRTFMSFFLEQSILCLFGTAVGLAIWKLIWGGLSHQHLWLTGGFVFCYFVGSAVSLIIMNRSEVLQILLDRE